MQHHNRGLRECESNASAPETRVTCSGGGLAGSLGGQLLAGRLATGGLTSCLLGAGHGNCCCAILAETRGQAGKRGECAWVLGKLGSLTACWGRVWAGGIEASVRLYPLAAWRVADILRPASWGSVTMVRLPRRAQAAVPGHRLGRTYALVRRTEGPRPSAESHKLTSHNASSQVPRSSLPSPPTAALYSSVASEPLILEVMPAGFSACLCCKKSHQFFTMQVAA